MNYPMEFKAVTHATSGINSLWNCQSGEINTELAIPPEFSGPGGGLSPEDLFNQALTNCFLATFKVYAEMSKLSFDSVKADSKLIVDLDENKKPVMKSLVVNVVFKNVSDQQKALMLAKKASRSGFILNSVKTDCTFNFEFCE